MKKMRKLATLLLALVMILSLAVPAFAAEDETFTITVPDGDTHEYEVYQIFTGDYAETDGSRVLSNVVWGVNGKGSTGEAVPDEVLDELAAAGGSDSEKLAVITKYVDLDSDARATAKAGEALTVAPGYYLLKDADGSVTGDDAYTTYIVLVVDDVTVNRKSAKPSVDKQVRDEAADGENGKEWGETADHEINESFQFKLIAEVKADSDYGAYETYKLVFHDTMSKGITFESIESVTVNGTSINNYTTSANLVKGLKGEAFWTLTIANLKSYGFDMTTTDITVEVVYNAHLNEDAAVGNIDDNKNTVYLEYSNNPNWEGEGDTEPTGKTPEDTVWVFTYNVDVTKVDGSDNTKKLEGAEFQMKNADGKWLVVDADGKVLEWVDDQAYASTLTSGANGLFTVTGLDHGTYHLVETKAPTGYNLLDEEITVEIKAAHQETTTGAETMIDASSTTEITVENNIGATLPETGGIGTTIFYVLGAVMVLGAAVLLVTKKRMAA